LLAGRHPVLGRYRAVRLNLLDAIGAGLLTISDPGRRLLDTRGANLLSLGAQLRALGANRARCRHPLNALRSLERRRTLLHARSLGALDALNARRAASSAALLHRLGALGALPTVTAMAARTGGGRSRDRQSGDSRGEIEPGHWKFSFERTNGPLAAPFQRADE